MVGLDGKKSYQFLYSFWLFIASVFEPYCWHSIALTAWTSYYQYLLYKILHWRVWFGRFFRDARAMTKCRFCRLRPNAKLKGLKPWCWDLKLKHLLVKTINNEGFEYSQLKNWLLLYYLTEKNEIEHLQFCFFSLDNNLFENDSEKAIGPTKLDKNSGFLCLWSDKSCCNW